SNAAVVSGAAIVVLLLRVVATRQEVGELASAVRLGSGVRALTGHVVLSLVRLTCEPLGKRPHGLLVGHRVEEPGVVLGQPELERNVAACSLGLSLDRSLLQVGQSLRLGLGRGFGSGLVLLGSLLPLAR